jgi:hypothetical protein
MGQNNTATRSSVSASASVVTLLAANPRSAATFYNTPDAGTLYLALGAAATTSDYTVQVAPGDYYEVPGAGGEVYDGIITGIWSAATGSVKVTEVA